MKIFKYELQLKDDFSINVPKDSIILDIQYHSFKLVLWAIIEQENELIERHFKIFGTGQNINYSYGLLHIATVQDPNNNLVWHIFEDER